MVNEEIIKENAKWEIRNVDNVISSLKAKEEKLKESLREFQSYVSMLLEGYIRGDISDGHFSEIKGAAEELREKFGELSNTFNEYKAQKKYHQSVLRHALSIKESRNQYEALREKIKRKHDETGDLLLVEVGELESYARIIGEGEECKRFLEELEPGLGERFNLGSAINKK